MRLLPLRLPLLLLLLPLRLLPPLLLQLGGKKGGGTERAGGRHLTGGYKTWTSTAVRPPQVGVGCLKWRWAGAGAAGGAAVGAAAGAAAGAAGEGAGTNVCLWLVGVRRGVHGVRVAGSGGVSGGGLGGGLGGVSMRVSRAMVSSWRPEEGRLKGVPGVLGVLGVLGVGGCTAAARLLWAGGGAREGWRRIILGRWVRRLGRERRDETGETAGICCGTSTDLIFAKY